jgi:anti-sigma-K factor RskA
LALLYVALACVYIAPGLYLSRYANAIKRLKVNSTAAGLEEALKHQKSFWRFIGILTAISLAVAVVVVGLAIVAGVIGAMMAARS